jgi:hypothetical protein
MTTPGRTAVAARALGLQLRLVEVRSPDDFDRAFSTITREHADALFVSPSSMLFTEGTRLVALAAKHRVPVLGNAKEFAELGGLISSGASILEGNRRAASYVDNILKGAKPADLPVDRLRALEREYNTGRPSDALQLRALLREAGFARTQASGTMATEAGPPAGSLEETRRVAQNHLIRLHGLLGDLAVRQGWATRQELEQMAEALIAWGEAPDAFYGRPVFTALAWA